MKGYHEYFDDIEDPTGPPPEGVHNVSRWFRCKICRTLYNYSQHTLSGGYFLKGDEKEVRGTMEVHVLRHEVAGETIPE